MAPSDQLVPGRRRVRVLVVDDSAVVRRIVVAVLSRHPDLEVVGQAADGEQAVRAIAELHPDVVTLDVEMPGLDGLGVLAELRRQRVPTGAVIMFSTVTASGARATLGALSLGAADYVTKPTAVANLDEALAVIDRELVPRIRALAGASAPPPARPAAAAPAAAPAVAPPTRGPGRVDAVVIGVSTGGPVALQRVLPALPADLPVPVLLVQHMPPVFTAMLAERLDGLSAITVTEAVHGAPVRAGEVVVAAGGRHLALHRSGGQVRVALTDDPPENSCRPSVDVLFRSAAEVYGGRALGVVLTGIGQDGLRGARAIRVAGGRVLAQDERSSVVWGMPGSVVRAGLADAEVALDDLAAVLVDEVTGRAPAVAAS